MLLLHISRVPSLLLSFGSCLCFSFLPVSGLSIALSKQIKCIQGSGVISYSIVAPLTLLPPESAMLLFILIENYSLNYLLFFLQTLVWSFSSDFLCSLMLRKKKKDAWLLPLAVFSLAKSLSHIKQMINRCITCDYCLILIFCWKIGLKLCRKYSLLETQCSCRHFIWLQKWFSSLSRQKKKPW